MALNTDVKDICDNLAAFGWRDLLLKVTDNQLDINQSSAAKLEKELTKSLSVVDRTQRGFEDFHPNGSKGITGGRPAKSLLLHAFSSPHVHPTGTNTPDSNPKHYPTLEDLDTIENFVYSLVADRSDLGQTLIAVFAIQYRAASRTSHMRYADMTYSRTGVARVGTTKAHYDASRRSFWVIPKSGGAALPVLPARYAVYLAHRATPGAAGSVQGSHSATESYVFPLHKLFEGTECLKGKNISINFEEFHRNEKLRKTHALSASNGGLPVPPGFDVNDKPYVRDSTNGGKLANHERVGATVLVVPKPGKTLSRTVVQKNSVSGNRKLVHFVVPKIQSITRPGAPGPRSTRFTTSTLEIPASGNDRLAPEYVNIRHEIDPNGPISQTPKDLNTLSASAFNDAMRDGGYAAAHFTDDSCDGCVEAVVTGLAAGLENLPAFSLITAPDFFPLADQSEVNREPTIQQVQPLSEGRLAVNPTLPVPSKPNVPAFDRNDRTVTAIVGERATGPVAPVVDAPNRMISFLPDAASNIFAPGWDTSRTRDSQGVFLTSSGLGSPFPEDAKLCAALSSFWPAVAPDNGRTFGANFGNQLPMLDEELGFHPKHERVTSGDVTSHRGWDGEFGPFFEKVGSQTNVNFADIARSDYVSQALAGRIVVSLTAEVQSEELIARHQALSECEAVLNASGRVHLVVVRKIDDWPTFGAGRPELTGGGFLMEFGELSGNPQPTSDKSRLRQRAQRRHVCQVGANGVAYKRGGAAFIFDPF